MDHRIKSGGDEETMGEASVARMKSGRKRQGQSRITLALHLGDERSTP